MRAHLRLLLAGVGVLAATTGTLACDLCSSRGSFELGANSDRGSSPPVFGSDPSASSSSGSGASPVVNPTRAIAEADIIQLDDEKDRVYAMSRWGRLAIVDASSPGRLALLGSLVLPGEPFEMYRRGDVLLTMSNHGVKGDGTLQAPRQEGSADEPLDPTTSAVLTAIDIRDPAWPKMLGHFKVAGDIADSRIVGNVLYLATYENISCFACAREARTVVTTFDIADPLTPRKIDEASFVAPPNNGYNQALASAWKRSIVATKDRLYVGGLSELTSTTTNEGIIDVLDITDPGGKLVRGARISTAGPILSRWQMDEYAGVLRVISQHGSATTVNADKFPDIDTFRIESASSLVRVGHTTMRLPRQETLKAVRFDGNRAYAITFAETDPLFTIDLTSPALPAQRGELVMPGWLFHLEPRGDRVIGLGLDRSDPAGVLNVSVVDVSNMDAPKLAGRSSFGPTQIHSDAFITGGVLAEDQDRIQKAFKIYQDGLIVVPFSAGAAYFGADACQSGGSGVQLLDLGVGPSQPILKRGLLRVEGNPRRAFRRDSEVAKEVIAVSDSNITSFSIDQRDLPFETANLVIGKCVPRTQPSPSPGNVEGRGEGTSGRGPSGWPSGSSGGGGGGGGDSCF